MVNFRYTILFLFLLGMTRSSTAQNDHWYKCFSGTIDKYPFTMHLFKMDQSFRGYYYYDRVQQPFDISGDDTTAGAGKINLLSFLASSQNNEQFILSLQNDSLTGTWRKGDSSSAVLPVKAAAKIFPEWQFDLIYTSGYQELRPKSAGSPKAHFEAASVWPKGNSTAAANLKKIINESFGMKNSQLEIGKILLANKRSSLATYLDDNRDLHDSEIVNAHYLNYDDQQLLLIVYQSPTILSLANSSYSYTGGAHGNYGTSYVSIDASTGKKIPLSGVLTPAGISRLNDLLEKNLRKNWGLPAKSSLMEAGLFTNKLEANKNFFLTGKGITFSYAPYEIGPYAIGEIVIFIPYADFGKGGLNAGFAAQ